MNKVLSIIIPAYNAEPYIEHLIQRLKPQINDKVEVLVVDDGSEFPYLAPYDWVRVIRTENRGAAAARNLGIRETTGQYISFIDSLFPSAIIKYGTIKKELHTTIVSVYKVNKTIQKIIIQLRAKSRLGLSTYLHTPKIILYKKTMYNTNPTIPKNIKYARYEL